MWYKNAGTTFVSSQITRLTDGRTDRIIMARPRLHFMQRGKDKYHEVKRLAEDRETWRKVTHQPFQ